MVKDIQGFTKWAKSRHTDTDTDAETDQGHGLRCCARLGRTSLPRATSDEALVVGRALGQTRSAKFGQEVGSSWNDFGQES